MSTPTAFYLPSSSSTGGTTTVLQLQADTTALQTKVAVLEVQQAQDIPNIITLQSSDAAQTAILTPLETAFAAATHLPTLDTLMKRDGTGGTQLTKLSTDSVESISTTLAIATDNHTESVTIGAGSSVQSINLGNSGTGVTTINIGGLNDIVNIAGTLTTVATANNAVTNKNLILNSGGAAGSAGTAGLYFEEAADNTSSYLRLASTRDKFEAKAPLASLITLNQSLSTTDSPTFVDPRASKVKNAAGVTILDMNVASTTNTLLGHNAGNSTNITGLSNTNLGANAGQAITSGSSNTNVGRNAGTKINTGQSNIMIGHNAGANLTAGTNNTCVGVSAGTGMTTSAAINNTLVGSFAGSAITTGWGNTLIGNNAAVADPTAANGIAIGAGAIAPATNTIQLGNASITNVYTSGVINAPTFVGNLTGTATNVAESAVLAKTLTGFSASAGTVASTDTILNAFNKVVGNIAALSTGSTTLAGDVTGSSSTNTVATVGGKTAAQIATSVDDTLGATSANTASRIVKRDATGNIYANLIGNVVGSTTDFSGDLSGDVEGTQGATVVSWVGNQLAAAVEIATISANSATSANTVNTLVKRDASGNFAATNITCAQLLGNATTATTAATATTCTTIPSLSGDVTSSGNAVTVTDSAVTGKLLTGFTAAAGTVAATDTILGAFKKVVGNINNITTGTVTLTGDVNGTTTNTICSTIGGKTAAQVVTSVNDTFNATSANTASRIVKRDAGGSIYCTNFVGTLTGYAGGFSGNLSGDVQGTMFSTSVASVGGQSAANVASGAVLANNATAANSASQLVKRDINGDFTARNITCGQLFGNAATATTANFCVALPSVAGDVYNTGNNIYLSNAPVINKVLTGFSAAAGTVQATDSILTAFNKVVGNINSFSSSVALTGDVTGTSGSSVVSLVGGKTAAQVSASVDLTAAATASNIASTLVKRDVNGDSALRDLTMRRLKNTAGSIVFNTESGASAGENTFVGACGSLSASGLGNFVGGLSAGTALTSGNYNVFIGKFAGTGTSTGTSNIGIGTSALASNVSSNNQVAVGQNALLSSTGGNSVAVGHQAGQTMTSGTNCTFLGTTADSTAGTFTNSTAIGYNAKVSASNTIQLGNTSVTSVNTSGTLTAAALISGGGLTVSGSAICSTSVFSPLLASSHFQIRSESFAAPTSTISVNCVSFASLTIPNGGTLVELTLVVDSAGFSLSKKYVVPIKWNATNGVWQRLIPRAVAKANDEDIALEINVTNGLVYFRAMRTQGSTAGTIVVKVSSAGVGTYTSVYFEQTDNTLLQKYFDGENCEQSLVGNWTGGVAGTSKTVKVVRQGKHVVITMHQFTATSSGTSASTFSVPLPSWAYPGDDYLSPGSASFSQPIMVTNNNGVDIGYVSIGLADHQLTFSRVHPAGWDSGTTCGLGKAQSITYITAPDSV